MKVRIVKETTLVNFGFLEKGKIIGVDEKNFTEKTLKRWVLRGIAVEVKTTQPEPVKQVKETAPVTDEKGQEYRNYEVVEKDEEISEMGFQELRRYAKENGYENYGKMNREELIELLSEKDEEEESNPFFDGVE